MNAANYQPNGDLNPMQYRYHTPWELHTNWDGILYSCTFSSFLCSASVNTFLFPILYFAYTTIACAQ